MIFSIRFFCIKQRHPGILGYSGEQDLPIRISAFSPSFIYYAKRPGATGLRVRNRF